MLENMGDLFRLYSEGKIKPRVSASYPLEQAGDALQLLSGPQRSWVRLW